MSTDETNEPTDEQMKNLLHAIEDPAGYWEERAARAENALAAEITGSTSDGYHTFDELYDYRRVYNAALFNEWWLNDLIPVVKSWRHSDGELAFGGGWFIVVATLPTGQISNHYEAEHWEQFQVPEVDLPPQYDGHTPAEALHRLVEYIGPDAYTHRAEQP